MVLKLRCAATSSLLGAQRVVRQTATVAIVLLLAAASPLSAQQKRDVHYLHHGNMPPGAIGGGQLQRGGPLPGFHQPVAIKTPAGVRVSLAAGGAFEPSQASPRRAGMLIGQVYRMRVTGIPMRPGVEVYPTVEVIDRLYAPVGQELRFPIPIELTLADLNLAADGKYVTRVVYVEDPRRALPIATNKEKPIDWFEAGRGQDPLFVADTLGRPVAIIRMGARLPDDTAAPSDQFLHGCPPWVDHANCPAPLSAPAIVPLNSGAAGESPAAKAPPTNPVPPTVEEPLR